MHLYYCEKFSVVFCLLPELNVEAQERSVSLWYKADVIKHNIIIQVVLQLQISLNCQMFLRTAKANSTVLMSYCSSVKALLHKVKLVFH